MEFFSPCVVPRKFCLLVGLLKKWVWLLGLVWGVGSGGIFGLKLNPLVLILGGWLWYLCNNIISLGTWGPRWNVIEFGTLSDGMDLCFWEKDLFDIYLINLLGRLCPYRRMHGFGSTMLMACSWSYIVLRCLYTLIYRARH